MGCRELQKSCDLKDLQPRLTVFSIVGPTTRANRRTDLANLLSDKFQGLVIHQSSSLGVRILLALKSPLSRSPLGRMTKSKMGTSPSPCPSLTPLKRQGWLTVLLQTPKVTQGVQFVSSPQCAPHCFWISRHVRNRHQFASFAVLR
jgi:hypothetical protein